MRRLLAWWTLIGMLSAPWLGAFAQEAKSVTLSIPKMYCIACELSVKKALKKVPGVESVDVSLEKKTAVVRFDPTKAETGDLIHATTQAGFPSSLSH